MKFIINLIEKIKLWWMFKELDIGQADVQDSFIFGISQDLDSNTILIVEDEQQRKYKEALNTIKTSVLKEASQYNSLEEYLAANPDLTRHANENNQVKDIIRNSWDLRNKDCENDEDLLNIINKRIEHFYELQKYNEKRLLIKQIKLAKKQGDMLEYNNLMKEWKNKYEIQRH